jgi:hypothetical protein
MDTSYILNGRINLFDEKSKSSKILNNNPQLYNEKNISTINRNISGNCVSEIFFSQENTNLIQQGIYNSVYNLSEGQYNIGKQSEQELKIIMRSIYFQHAKNLNFDLKEQVRELNTLVIRWCVDEIIKNIKQYIEYKKNVSTLPLPLEHSQLPSQKGTKILEIKSFI